MFDIYCPRHQSRVLLGNRSIESIVNTAKGIEVRWRCHCGATGAELTGRRASMSPSVDPAAPAA